jgi:hypothetical protein
MCARLVIHHKESGDHTSTSLTVHAVASFLPSAMASSFGSIRNVSKPAQRVTFRSLLLGSETQCSTRHTITSNSRNEGMHHGGRLFVRNPQCFDVIGWHLSSFYSRNEGLQCGGYDGISMIHNSCPVMNGVEQAAFGISLPASSADALSATLYGHLTWRLFSRDRGDALPATPNGHFTQAIYRTEICLFKKLGSTMRWMTMM